MTQTHPAAVQRQQSTNHDLIVATGAPRPYVALFVFVQALIPVLILVAALIAKSTWPEVDVRFLILGMFPLALGLGIPTWRFIKGKGGITQPDWMVAVLSMAACMPFFFLSSLLNWSGLSPVMLLMLIPPTAGATIARFRSTGS
jgi:hypothetical protein